MRKWKVILIEALDPFADPIEPIIIEAGTMDLKEGALIFHMYKADDVTLRSSIYAPGTWRTCEELDEG